MIAPIVYIAVFCHIVGNPENGYSTEYSTDGLRYNYSAVAKSETEAQYGHDDFLVAQVRDQQLLAIVDNVGEHDLDTIAQQLDLDYLAPIAGWSVAPPTKPGAYYVRGYAIGAPFSTAVVEVMLNEKGVLVCNLHRRNIEQDTRLWLVVDEMFGDLEWKGPLVRVDVAELDSLLSGWQSQFDSGVRPLDDEPDEQSLWDRIQALRDAIKEKPNG